MNHFVWKKLFIIYLYFVEESMTLIFNVIEVLHINLFNRTPDPYVSEILTELSTYIQLEYCDKENESFQLRFVNSSSFNCQNAVIIVILIMVVQTDFEKCP